MIGSRNTTMLRRLLMIALRIAIIAVCFWIGWFWRDVTAKRDASNCRLHIRFCMEEFSDAVMSEFDCAFDRDVFEKSFTELMIKMNTNLN